VELAREEDVVFVSNSALTLCSRTHIYESRTHMDQSQHDVNVWEVGEGGGCHVHLLLHIDPVFTNPYM